MARPRYNCIGFFKTYLGIKPHKYRNVRSLQRFHKFAITKGFIYFNVYRLQHKKDKTGPFQERIWVRENFKPIER